MKAFSAAAREYPCKIEKAEMRQQCAAGADVWSECLRKRRPAIRNSASFHRKNLPGGPAGTFRELAVPVMRRGKVVAILGVGNKPFDYTDKDLKIVSYFADIAWLMVEHQQSEEIIRYISFHDMLTGLYNRVFVKEEMRRLDTARQLPISVIMADLNGLKLVNDTYGHSVGDRMLRSAAEIIKNSCRQEDIVARWGGDEFLVLLPQTNRKKVKRICRRIREKCCSACIDDVPISLAFSFAVKKNTGTGLCGVIKEAEDLLHKRKLADSRSTKSAVLKALLKTLGAKSFETEEHSRRMQAMAWKFGKELGLPDSEQDRLSLLITLHDIGKVNIPEQILAKKGSLNADEWAIMKKHPEMGFRITRSTAEFAHVAEDILSHHEHWDGSGYPRGLKGKEIPYLARITAIVDAYEVMTNGRPYRKKLSTEEAVKEIRRCSGTQFDPKLARYFVNMIGRDD